MNTRWNKIVVTGSLAFDFIMDFPGKFSDHILPEKIHSLNLSFLVKTMEKQRGGTAGNIAYNLALLGLKPTILATAGYDFEDYKKELERVGVNTSMIRIIKAEPTASAYIFTDQADNQITGFYPGAMKHAQELALTRLHLVRGLTSQDSREFFVVISPNEPSAMINLAKECQKLDISYMFDPGMQLPRLSDGDLKQGISGAGIVIGNDYEMAMIRKILRYKDIKIIRKKGQKDTSDGGRPEAMTPPKWRIENQIWITTLGEKGSIIEANGRRIIIPAAKPNEVLDPTGAGDTYRAGFLAGFLRGLPLKTCGRMGSVAAVYTVEKYGTQTHKFIMKEFEKRYKKNFNQELKL